MKTKSLIANVIFILPVLFSMPSFGQSNVVFYGTQTNSIRVAFADTNLSSPVQLSIVSDLRLCLQEWGKGSDLRLRDKGDSAGHLYNPALCPHYPENLEFPDNVINVSGSPALEITKTLSDAYTNAFAFAAAHSNAVAAAYEFVAFVASGDFANISSNALPGYIMFKNALADPAAESNAIARLAPQIIPDLLDQTFHPPSILGFYQSPDGPAPTNLWVLVPCSFPRFSEGLGWAPLTAIWHGGRWKFCVWADWVP